MKNLLCLLVVALAAVGAYAQEKPLTQTEFDALYRRALAAWSPENRGDRPFRQITITGSLVEGRPQTDYRSKLTAEYVSPTISRIVHESTFGDRRSTTESIRTGDLVYVRRDGGEWKRETTAALKTESARGASPDAEPAGQIVEYKYPGAEKLDDRTAGVYVKSARTERDEPAGKAVTTATTKYWIGEDGALLKSEMVMETRSGEKTTRTLLTQTWEADASIRVEAPSNMTN